MRTLLLSLSAAAALSVPCAVLAAPERAAVTQPAPIKPRAVVEHAAAAIEEQYVDRQRAKMIAGDLRADAAKGAFDRLTDPRDLASALTDRLKPLDQHFSVSWAPAPPAATAGTGPGETQARAEQALAQRRSNYGFKRVEMLPGAIGLIEVSGFAHFDQATEPDAPARKAADAAMALVSGADAVIIDLRDNGGGSPSMVGYLAGYFAPKGADIYNTFHSSEGESSEAPVIEPTGPRRLDTPLYILVSGRTASAGEAFVYTLQIAKRATVIGERTAGGANPGGSGPIGDGFAIFISTGRPVNPITKTNWEGTGVTPDVEVPWSQALRRAQAMALHELAKAPPAGAAGVENRWVLEALEASASPDAGSLAPYAGDYGIRKVTVEDGRLMLKQGRRPAVTLTPISADLFAVEGAPGRRYQFERDGGQVRALIQLSPGGEQSRQARPRPGA